MIIINHEDGKIKFIYKIDINVWNNNNNPMDIGLLRKLIVIETITIIFSNINLISTNSLLKFNFWVFKMYIILCWWF